MAMGREGPLLGGAEESVGIGRLVGHFDFEALSKKSRICLGMRTVEVYDGCVICVKYIVGLRVLEKINQI